MRLLRASFVSLLVALAASADVAQPHKLRVCADPNNLPFSNQREEGLENALARLVAREMDAELEYTWLPQRRGFVRNTLAAKRCDVMMEVPAGYGRALATEPYYRSTYVFVSRKDRGLKIRSFDDPSLRKLRIGVQMVGDDYANTPPAHALGRRGLAANVVGYSVFGDYSRPDPLAAIVDGVVSGEVDIAVVWGPIAGYFARKRSVPLSLVPVTPVEDPPYKFTFDVAMGVRRDDRQLRDELDRIIRTRREEIAAIVAQYGVPRAPETR
jgi:quinoprotein dehydrogenase-associated probable ABC transporter substrate-binding protein